MEPNNEQKPVSAQKADAGSLIYFWYAAGFTAFMSLMWCLYNWVLALINNQLFYIALLVALIVRFIPHYLQYRLNVKDHQRSILKLKAIIKNHEQNNKTN